MVVIVLGVVFFIIAVGLQANNTATVSEELGQSEARTERVADDLGDLATRVVTLCAAGGPAVTLESAQICPLAEAAIANPEIGTVSLTRAEVTAIAQAAIAAQATTVDMDAITAQVLAAVRADPTLSGLDEAQVRSIVEAAIAAQPDPEDGEPGEPGEPGAPGRPGSSFEGFQRDPETGDCFAVITTTGADGSTSTARQPAGDAACAPRSTPNPDPVDPDPTTEPVDPDPPEQITPGLPTPTPAPPTSDAGDPLFTE